MRVKLENWFFAILKIVVVSFVLFIIATLLLTLIIFKFCPASSEGCAYFTIFIDFVFMMGIPIAVTIFFVRKRYLNIVKKR